VKVLYVVNEAHFFLSHRLPIARAARAAGWDVHLAAPADHVWAPDGFGVDEVRAAGLVFHEIPVSRRGTNPLRDARTLWALYRLYRRLRPDLVHHITIKPVLYGGIAARLARLPAVVNAVPGLGRVFVARGLRAALLRRAVTFAYRLATGHGRSRVIVQNPADAERLVGAGAVAAGRIVLIRGSGVDLEEFAATPDPGGTPVVILAARLLWEKGVGEFAAAARRLRERGVEARFALLGDCREAMPDAVPRAWLAARADEGVLEWWGRRTDMARVMAGCHVVCLPSSYGEGVPKVLIEAAAAGRPIVASDIPGCREIVEDGRNGLLVPPRDADALADALERLIGDRDLRERMGREGRRIAEASFSEGAVVARTLEIYRELGPPPDADPASSA